MSQPLDALQVANRVRFAAADVKREIRDGRLRLADALWDERADPIVLRDLLLVQVGEGPWRVDTFLNRVEVNGHRRVRDLTERQRRVVADAA
jgi:predicted DNA binding protein